MAKNVTLLGANYPSVPAVVLPQTGGGNAVFVDADEVGNIEEAIAIVIDGDIAPKAITAGQYLFIKNHSTLATGGYHATSNIASGATVSSNNVAADPDGITNALNSKIPSIESFSLTPASNVSNLTQNCCKYGRIVQISCEFTITSTTGKTLADLLTIPEEYRPTTGVYFAFLDNTNDKVMSGRVTTTGIISAFRDYTNATSSERFTFCYII